MVENILQRYLVSSLQNHCGDRLFTIINDNAGCRLVISGEGRRHRAFPGGWLRGGKVVAPRGKHRLASSGSILCIS